MSDQASFPKFVVIDIETTGLNPHIDIILEIGVIICDSELNELDRRSHVILWEEKFFPELDPVVRKMHEESGLLEEVFSSNKAYIETEVENALFDFIYHFPAAGNPMCGSSVHFDRAFLKELFPSFEGLFHYRNIDVSTVKGLCNLWNPDLAEKAPKGRKLHRSLPDCEDTIEELRFYKENLLK